MYININQLKSVIQFFDVSLNIDQLPRLQELAVVSEINFRAVVGLVSDGQLINFDANYTSSMTKNCVKCLEKFELELNGKFNLILLPIGHEGLSGQSHQINEFNADLDYYENNKLNLDKYLEDQLIIESSTFDYCKPDCNGLCGICGINLNSETCFCADKISTKLNFSNYQSGLKLKSS